MSKDFKYSAFGEKHTIVEWGEIYGLSPSTIRKRMRHGMSLEEALKYKYKHRGTNTVSGVGYLYGKPKNSYRYISNGINYTRDVEYYETINSIKKDLRIEV